MSTQATVARLSGDVKAHSTRGYRDWEGKLEASEPFVAISAIRCGNTLHWAKSSHRGSTSLPVRILLAPMGTDFTEVQVNLSIGEDGHVRYLTRVPTIDYRPLPLLDSFRFGILESLAVVEGEPSLELAMVAIPLTQIESSRNGLWLANENWVAQLKAPLPNVLKHGRSGILVET